MITLLYSIENKAVVESTAQFFKLLESNNDVTNNAGSLLKVFLVRATELKASAQCDK